jgi:hypothetical protein
VPLYCRIKVIVGTSARLLPFLASSVAQSKSTTRQNRIVSLAFYVCVCTGAGCSPRCREYYGSIQYKSKYLLLDPAGDLRFPTSPGSSPQWVKHLIRVASVSTIVLLGIFLRRHHRAGDMT